jgi:hypothetical protein
MFKNRIGPDPHPEMTASPTTSAGNGCPDIWELESGDVAIIGVRKTSVLSPHLPSGAGCGPDEEIVVIPRSLLLNARDDILKL